jgi:hypothetical protein
MMRARRMLGDGTGMVECGDVEVEMFEWWWLVF